MGYKAMEPKHTEPNIFIFCPIPTRQEKTRFLLHSDHSYV